MDAAGECDQTVGGSQSRQQARPKAGGLMARMGLATTPPRHKQHAPVSQLPETQDIIMSMPPPVGEQKQEISAHVGEAQQQEQQDGHDAGTEQQQEDACMGGDAGEAGAAASQPQSTPACEGVCAVTEVLAAPAQPAASAEVARSADDAVGKLAAGVCAPTATNSGAALSGSSGGSSLGIPRKRAAAAGASAGGSEDSGVLPVRKRAAALPADSDDEGSADSGVVRMRRGTQRAVPVSPVAAGQALSEGAAHFSLLLCSCRPASDC